MRLRWLLVLPAAAAAILAAALLRPRAPEPAVERVEPPAPEASAPAAPSAETEALELDGELISAREASFPEASGAKVEPQVEDQSPPVELHGTLIDLNTRLPLPEFGLEFEVVGAGEGLNLRTSARTDEQGRFECAAPILVARCVVRYVDRPGHRRPPPEATLELEDVRKGELALAIAWGPTYRVAFAPKDRIEPPSAELRLRGSGGGPRNPSASQWEPAHAGEPAWVRFPPIDKNAPRIERLAARTRDGLWAGEAEASTTSGFAPGITLVSFEER